MRNYFFGESPLAKESRRFRNTIIANFSRDFQYLQTRLYFRRIFRTALNVERNIETPPIRVSELDGTLLFVARLMTRLCNIAGDSDFYLLTVHCKCLRGKGTMGIFRYAELFFLSKSVPNKIVHDSDLSYLMRTNGDLAQEYVYEPTGLCVGAVMGSGALFTRISRFVFSWKMT